MCNGLHVGYEKIAPEGRAYKLVRQRTGAGCMMLTEKSIYNVDTDGWIRWKGRLREKPVTEGFCFIPTLKEAKRTRKVWEKATRRSSTKIVEVEYKLGLGRFKEARFVGGQRIDVMLAREFKIIKEVT